MFAQKEGQPDDNEKGKGIWAGYDGITTIDEDDDKLRETAIERLHKELDMRKITKRLRWVRAFVAQRMQPDEKHNLIVGSKLFVLDKDTKKTTRGNDRVDPEEVKLDMPVTR